MRTVTGIGSGYVDISPALSRNSLVGESIIDWKTGTDFVYDLNLQNTSPAIDAGADLSADIGSTDKNGNSHSGGSWDIGAYESF